jgi:hypothetical protein
MVNMAWVIWARSQVTERWANMARARASAWNSIPNHLRDNLQPNTAPAAAWIAVEAAFVLTYSNIIGMINPLRSNRDLPRALGGIH